MRRTGRGVFNDRNITFALARLICLNCILNYVSKDNIFLNVDVLSV
jgi:hypothetical protein